MCAWQGVNVFQIGLTASLGVGFVVNLLKNPTFDGLRNHP